MLTQNSQSVTSKIFGVSLKEIGRIFSIKIRNFQLWKMPKLLNFKFPEG